MRGQSIDRRYESARIGHPRRPRARSSASKDHNRRFSLLASIIALASAVFVLIVFGIGRMPLRAKDADSVGAIPEPPRNTDPPVPRSETSAPAGDTNASPIARAGATSRPPTDEAVVAAPQRSVALDRAPQLVLQLSVRSWNSRRFVAFRLSSNHAFTCASGTRLETRRRRTCIATTRAERAYFFETARYMVTCRFNDSFRVPRDRHRGINL
jgi:hypothetical protein